ncbi:MAG: DUF799 family lipoprotein [Nitrospira sp.]|nr:DUF799 family lipoprotein [Nitrospira sp.]
MMMTGKCLSVWALVFVATLGGCKPMFETGIYEDSLLAMYGQGRDAQAADLLSQSIASSEMVQATIPPGVYADHGILLYQQGKTSDGVAQLSKELEHYPESLQLVEGVLRLIKKTKVEQQVADKAVTNRSPSILLLPTLNKSGAPEAGQAFDVTLSRPLIERGYYVFPAIAARMLLQQAGMNLENPTHIELSTLRSLTGADAVLYVTVTEWERVWMLTSLIRVAAEYRLVDTTTGHEIWKSTVEGRYEPIATGAIGGPVYAMAKDLRLPARGLTRKAFTASENGLAYGPYH